AEPGVEVLVTTDPEVVDRADLAVLPGSRSTVADLDWLRRTGLAALTAQTGLACAGVVPWLPDLILDAEDSLAVGRWRRPSGAPDALRVAVVPLPRVSNVTDVDALAAEPGVEVLVSSDPTVVAGADLAVLPGSRATVSDLDWLRRTGLAGSLEQRAGRQAPTLGVCGGYQMLAETIVDDLESGRGTVPGLGLLPARVTFSPDKTLGRPVGSWRGHALRAYEIHHGRAEAHGGEPFLDGVRAGQVWGTMWHGAFENDGFRRAWLQSVAEASGSRWRPHPDAPPYGARRENMINTLADAVAEHVNLDAVLAPAKTTESCR
ncbi:MAG: cobyric acid synthase CobQ, partial [Actinomycetes bacterium]